MYLLDAFNLLFRAFSSLPPTIVDDDKLPVNAVYGMLAFVLRLRREYGAERMVAAFDVPHIPTFRHHLYPPYQAQRGPLGGEGANEFLRQVDLARRVLPALGIPPLSAPGYEADDIMGTLGVRAAASVQTTLVTTDRDALQLVRPNLAVAVPGTELRVARTDDDVRERLGVPAAGVTSFKALAGDSSDNVPGVRGIGTKTAATLVSRYGSLDAIYAHLDDLTPRQRSLLEAGREDAYLFLRIVTIETELDIPLQPESIEEVSFTANDRVRDMLRRGLDIAEG